MKAAKIIIAGFICVAILTCGGLQAQPGSDQEEQSAQVNGSTPLFPIEKDGKYGYIDKAGNIVINLQFDYAGLFCDGLAVVSIGSKYGYIDKTGKVVMEPQFSGTWDFSEGLAKVQIGDEKTGKYGYVDKTGKVVIEPQFDMAQAFSEGLAAVRIGDKKTGKWAYIDSTGKIVIEPLFGLAFAFSEGLARVKIVIEPEQPGGVIFSGPFAQMSSGSPGKARWSYIDKTGTTVINLQQFSFGGSTLGIPFNPNTMGLGTPMLMPSAPESDPTQWDDYWALDFSEGVAMVRIGDEKTRKCGYVDTTGKIVIEPQFADYGCKSFSEGLASISVDGKYGYIEKTGKMIIQPQFNLAFDFSEGLAAVKIGDWETGKYGYIDKTGNIIINPQFDLALEFTEGLAKVRVGDYKTGKYGYIDKTGKYVWEPAN